VATHGAVRVFQGNDQHAQTDDSASRRPNSGLMAMSSTTTVEKSR
jgi:hypothetical protein